MRLFPTSFIQATWLLLSVLFSSVVLAETPAVTHTEPLNTTSSASAMTLKTDKNDAIRMIENAAEKIDKFDSTEHWDSVKRLTGVAKAILIFPAGGQVGFLLGAQWGEGILMTRHGQQWSEPIFVEFNSAMFGLLVGAQKIGGIGVILSDDVIDDLVASPIKVGGTADLTVGSGISGKVIGGTSGISAMMVSENTGLYFGGSIDTFQLKLNASLNRAMYGEGADLSAVLNRFESEQGYAQTLRKRLEGIAYRSVYQ
ncbi:lipid-binding SYLF domain-containing protein [Vibrio sp. 10N.261.51.F12]|uniref:lipid-binding SYLF domain-containing protein n=1 Tax=Vibrio sp. 10N.261.51.F12 TaxID=3229679 RepID=UPI0035518540